MATERICTIEGCGKKYCARGLCSYHYYHRKDLWAPAKRNVAREFLNEALLSDTEECIIWPYNVGNNGYGRIGPTTLVHRLVCESRHGTPISPKNCAAHACGVRACINPRHLRWATPAENSADTVAHGRSNRGERATYAKLTEAAVRDIRTKRETVAATAARYGISEWTVIDVRRRRNWKHVG